MDNTMRQDAYQFIKDKWSLRHQETKQTLKDNHAPAISWIQNIMHPKKLLVGSLSSLVLLNIPATTALAAHNQSVVFSQNVNTTLSQNAIAAPVLTNETLSKELAPSLPLDQQQLTLKQDKIVRDVLSKYFKLDVESQLDGISLNTNYGYIGAEQHLMLYPGDNIYTHFQTAEGYNEYGASGMAPGRGAWGYFAPSKETLTPEDIAREKYYIAVQTFLSPGYSDNVQKYYNFFKYRKVLVVNPQNGKAIVADIADAGPSPFTGKQLGGSPEVMRYLNRVDGMQRGSVLYFFIGDSNTNVPLGPIDIAKP